MIRRLLLVTLSAVVILAGIGILLYATNLRPEVLPLSALQAADPDKPFVVKLHAQWCPACLVTKSVWSRIESTYAGQVKLVVLDFTTQADVEASRQEATRLGLEEFFEEYSGATGLVAVLDGATKEVLHVLSGRDFDDYRTAIDTALTRAARQERLVGMTGFEPATP